MCSANLSRIPWNNAEDDSCQVLLMPAGLFLGEKIVLGLHVPFCAGQELAGTCLAVPSLSVEHQLVVLDLGPSWWLRGCRRVGTVIWMTTDNSTINTSCSKTPFPVVFVPGASPAASLSPLSSVADNDRATSGHCGTLWIFAVCPRWDCSEPEHLRF